MEDENTRTLEKTSLLGSEKRLFRSLSGSDSTKNSNYQKIPSTQHGKNKSDIQEEIETTNEEFHDSMPEGYSLGSEMETYEDEKKNTLKPILLITGLAVGGYLTYRIFQ